MRKGALAALLAGVGGLGLLWALAPAPPAAPADPGGLRRLDPPAAPGAMAPNLAVAGGDLLATWLEPQGEGHRLRFARLSGERWSAASTVAAGPGFFANWADFPAAAAGPGGGLLAHWLMRTGEGYAYEVRLARSGDGGTTWSALGTLHDDATPTEHGFVSFLPEREGVRAFWLDGREMVAEKGPMTLRTALVATRPGPGEVIDGDVCTCCQTDAALTAEGPIVVYRDHAAGEIRDISAVRRTAHGWSRPAPVHRDGWKIPGCPVNGPAVAAAGRRVAVAWFTGAPPGPRVLAAFSEDAGATFGRPVAVDADRPLGRVDLALAPDGGAVVSWLALAPEGDTQGRATVRLRRISPAGALGKSLALAATSAARSSGFPRLARLGDRLVLAWVEDGKPGRLRAATLPLTAVPAPGGR